jgi:hypothetical protein
MVPTLNIAGRIISGFLGLVHHAEELVLMRTHGNTLFGTVFFDDVKRLHGNGSSAANPV